MSLADLDSIDRANERRCDMADFLIAHPEWRVLRATLPTKYLLDGADYVPADKTDLRATFARLNPERTS